MLWLCLHFPQLALEVFIRQKDGHPYAVSTGSERERWIHSCNAAATTLGIVPGMRLGAAHALADISILERDESLESAALERLAAWSGQYTSIISVVAPAILEAAVVAKTDEKWGETPCAFITLQPGATLSAGQVISYCRDNMARFKAPKHVVFTDLPKTSTGKIQKFLLREIAEQVQ